MTNPLRIVGTIGNNYPLRIAGTFQILWTGETRSYARINPEHVPDGLEWSDDWRSHTSGDRSGTARQMARGADGRTYLRNATVAGFAFGVEVES